MDDQLRRFWDTANQVLDEAGAERGQGNNIPGMSEHPSRQELDAKFATARAEQNVALLELRGDMREGFADLRAEIAGLGKSFAEDRTTHVKYLLIAGTAFSTLIIAVLGAWIPFSTKNGSSQPAIAPPPTIIYVSPPAAVAPAAPASTR